MFEMRMKNVAAVAFVLIITAIFAAAQEQNRPDSQTTAPDAKSILMQVAETYKNLKSYHFEANVRSEQKTESMGKRRVTISEEEFVVASLKPDHYRMESKNPEFSMSAISDGKTSWTYSLVRNEFTKNEVGSDPQKLHSGPPPRASQRTRR